MQRALAFFLILAVFMLQATPALAAKKAAASSTISASGQYIRARNVARVFFGNLKGASKVTYTLFYEGNGIGQGAVGSFSPGKKTSWSKDLYLGTCSGKVCISHKNIKNIQLEVIVKYKNGKSSTKIYKVK